ncbi:hypothetical protein [Bellilinea caldifistulae]|uniref:hypothetical protein n=1 Tax=Bellilinea caldifistulae TaxID=360411 RepID=UPI0011AEC103|nr:hypothetical protein [Bellilinea caldifistulae]
MSDFDDDYFTNGLQPLYSCLSAPIFWLSLRYTQKAVKSDGQTVNCPKTVTKKCIADDKTPKTNQKLLTFIPHCLNVKAAGKDLFCRGR